MASFDWCTFLNSNSKFKAAPVESFPHIIINKKWPNFITIGLKVEIQNSDAALTSNIQNIGDCFWVASVIKIEGFFVLFRFEG